MFRRIAKFHGRRFHGHAPTREIHKNSISKLRLYGVLLTLSDLLYNYIEAEARHYNMINYVGTKMAL